MSQNLDNVKNGISKFSGTKVLVVGDIMLDWYIRGSVSRVSPEAPVPVVLKSGEEQILGGAANVASNVAALGGSATLAGVIGDDAAGELLLELLAAHDISPRGVFRHPVRPTTVKHRIVSDGHQLLRLDIELAGYLDPEEENNFFDLLEPEIAAHDIVVLSDYAKGVFSPSFTQRLIAAAREQGKLVIADLKPASKEVFRGADLIAPNFAEAQAMAEQEDIEDVGRSLVDYFASDVIVTRGGEGMSVFSVDGNHVHFPARKIKVYDITGAGDTVMAALALSLASGLSVVDAAFIANAAGSVVVQKPGTSTVGAEELFGALQTENHLEGAYTVEKIWGHEKWLENNDKYCCKLLSLKKGYQCSLHYHKNKDETFFVTKGHVRLELNKDVMHLREGNFVRIPPNTPHRFSGLEDSAIIEASTHHDEEDSYRIEPSGKMREA